MFRDQSSKMLKDSIRQRAAGLRPSFGRQCPQRPLDFATDVPGQIDVPVDIRERIKLPKALRSDLSKSRCQLARDKVLVQPVR
jgi:hypothetical protein